MKPTLLFLSILITFSCERPKPKTETDYISNEELIDSIIDLSTRWSDSIDIEIENIGVKLKAPYSFYNIGNSYHPRSILIKYDQEKKGQLIQNSTLLKELDCASDETFKVCHYRDDKGLKLRYSFMPHPTLKWIFRIERVN
jgi:hypothetical protein